MPDAFFSSSKPRKRKRTESVGKSGKPTGFTKKPRKGPSGSTKEAKANGISHRKPRADEELSDKTDEEDAGIDDLDLRPDADLDEAASGSEDEDETPAEKRLRLAQLYLDSVKKSLGECFYSSFRMLSRYILKYW
jgi:ribosomal RNA-processing protein 9